MVFRSGMSNCNGYVKSVCITWFAGFFVFGCESPGPVKVYRHPPLHLIDQVDWVCANANLTQFTVRDRRIYARSKRGGEPVAAGHINIVLPDGSYFCTEQDRPNPDYE